MLLLILLVAAVQSQNSSSVSSSELSGSVTPFGQSVQFVPFQAPSDSTIFVDLLSPANVRVGTGSRNVRDEFRHTSVNVFLDGILPFNEQFTWRVYIVPIQDAGDADPLSKALDVQTAPVTVGNASFFEVYTISLTLNSSAPCNPTEDAVEEALLASLPNNYFDVFVFAQSTFCLDAPGYSRSGYSIHVSSIGGGEYTDRLNALYDLYKLVGESPDYINELAGNLSLTLTVDKIFVSGYDFDDTNPSLARFWQVFGSMLAVMGWIIVVAFILNIFYVAVFGYTKVETV